MQINFNLKGVSAYGAKLPLDSQVELSLLSCLPAEMKSVARHRQSEFLAGRFCAFEAAKEIGLELKHLPSSPTREPLWPDGIKGSITHSKQLAIGCVSLSDSLESIGIDAEEIIKPGLGKEIEKTIAHPEELILLKQHLPVDGLTLLFSAKESLYKALFPLVKTYIDFKEVMLTDLDPEKKQFTLNLISPKLKLASHLGNYSGSYQKLGETIVTVVSIPKKQKR